MKRLSLPWRETEIYCLRFHSFLLDWRSAKKEVPGQFFRARKTELDLNRGDGDWFNVLSAFVKGPIMVGSLLLLCGSRKVLKTGLMRKCLTGPSLRWTRVVVTRTSIGFLRKGSMNMVSQSYILRWILMLLTRRVFAGLFRSFPRKPRIFRSPIIARKPERTTSDFCL